MERRPPLPMTPFDSMVTTPGLQMMKLMLPYLPSAFRRMLAFYIKFTELNNTIHIFFSQNGSTTEKDMPFEKQQLSPAGILEDLRPYMEESDANMLDSILSAMNMMEMMKGMDFSGMDLSNFTGQGDMSQMMEMMNLFESNYNEESNIDNADRSDEHERMDEQPTNAEPGSY